ncbi:MAG: cell division protein ZapE [Pseudomonadota bacterium]
MTIDLTQRYEKRISLGEIKDDPAQRHAIGAFERVATDLATIAPQSFADRLFRRQLEKVKGLYLWGGVGRGKTMLMDMFFAGLQQARKRRAHFHGFMADVHDRIGRARQDGREDPISVVAAEILSETSVLCFDELHITDITDAMLVGRLFEKLFDGGLVVVATSNVPPEGLYANGLNRDLFVPFIGLIEAHMHVLAFPDGEDFRLAKLKGRALYFVPDDEAARDRLQELWSEVASESTTTRSTLEVQGRRLQVPMMSDGCAWFTFAELCEAPLGTRDYLAIAKAFHTVFLSGIPRLSPAKRNEARRLINLIDTLYDERVSLIATADAAPDEIYQAGDGADLFARTASRLVEMQSDDYLADRHARLAVKDAA